MIALLKAPAADAPRRLERRNFPRKEIRGRSKAAALTTPSPPCASGPEDVAARPSPASVRVRATTRSRGESVTISAREHTFGGWDATAGSSAAPPAAPATHRHRI